MDDQERHEAVMSEIKDVKGSVHNIYKIINGNGKEGIVVRQDRNTQFRLIATKAIWGLFGLSIGLITVVVKMAFAGN